MNFEILSSLGLKSDEELIVDDFNMHVDIETDCLGSTFISIGFSQCVHKSAHCLNCTLDLALTYGIKIDHLPVFPHNSF